MKNKLINFKKSGAFLLAICMIFGYSNLIEISATGDSSVNSANQIVLDSSQNYYIMSFILDNKVTDSTLMNVQCDPNYSSSIRANIFVNGKSIGDWCLLFGDYGVMIHIYQPSGGNQGRIDIWSNKIAIPEIAPNKEVSFEIRNNIVINTTSILPVSYTLNPQNSVWYQSSDLNGASSITEDGNYYIMRFVLDKKVTDSMIHNAQADVNFSAAVKQTMFINGKSIGEWCTQLGHDYAAMVHFYPPTGSDQGYIDIWVDKGSVVGVDPTKTITYEIKYTMYINGYAVKRSSYIYKPTQNWYKVSQINNAAAITENGNYYIMRFILNKKVTDTTLMHVQADLNYSVSVKSNIFINGKSVGEWCTQLGHDYAAMIHIYGPQNNNQGYMDIWVDKGSVVGVDPTKAITFELKNYVYIGNNAIQTVRYNYNPSGSQWTKDSYMRHNPDVIEANVTTDTNGVPRLYIDGMATPPLIFWGNITDTNKQSTVLHEIGKAKDSYVNIVSTFVPAIWSPTGAYDFGTFDSYLDMILNANANAKILLRLPIDFNLAPWESAYPNEKMLYEDSSTGPIAVTSSNWQTVAEQGVSAVIDHVLSNPKYSRCVIGYHVTSGEWFQPLFNSKGIDFSNPSLIAFRTYLSEKYGTNTALQTAWGDGTVTLGNAQIPTVPMNLGTDSYSTMMLLETAERKYIDYYDFISDIIANKISRISKIIKDKTDNRSLVVAFYGYTLELPDPKAGHSALTKVLQDTNIDMLASPMSYYNNRIEKGIGGFMSLVDSVALHNKIWIVENDLRTNDIQAGEEDTFNPKTATMAGAIEVEKREMGMLLTRNIGTWWMDLYGNGWVSDSIWDNIKPLASFYSNYSKNYTGFKPDVAFIVDESSMKMMANPNYTGGVLLNYQRDAIYRSGVSFGFYETSDIAAGRVPDAKLYVFMNPWDLDEVERAGIIANLKVNGKTIMWMNGFGNLSQTAIENLTGMIIKKDSSNTMLETSLNTTNHAINNYLIGKSNVFGSVFSNPYYYVDDGNTTTLGLYDVVGKTSLAVKEMNGFKSVFYGGLKLSPDLIRAVAKYAGINVYSESNDAFSSNNDFIMIHSNLAGNKTINFATNCDAFDYFQGTWYLNVNSVTVNMQEGTTKYFLFGSKTEIETKYFTQNAPIPGTYEGVVNGVTEGEYYDLAEGDLTITFSEGTATLNGNEFLNGSKIVETGTYILVINDIYSNTKTINFTVTDTSYPAVTGVSEGEVYTDRTGQTIISFNKGTAKLNGQPILSGTALCATGLYTLIVKANNTTTIHFSYIKYGDVTGDGIVDVADLGAIKKHLLKNEVLNAPYSLAGDIYQKGNISISDLIAIKKHILGM